MALEILVSILMFIGLKLLPIITSLLIKGLIDLYIETFQLEIARKKILGMTKKVLKYLHHGRDTLWCVLILGKQLMENIV